MQEIRDPNERRIGPYSLVGTLARGATCEVVRAIDVELNQTVAIKLLSPELVDNPEAMARFERESKYVLDLEHPNIARIIEMGLTEQNQPFIVMEFVEGRSLKDLIQDKIELRFSVQIDIILQAAEGLNAALNQSVIHRDIKPANIMVDPDYRVRVIDFGLAKVIAPDTYQSVAGALMGTPRYMAPEVAMGRTADYRSDIYSLGATFFHLATGQPPFEGETPAQVMMQHVNAPLTPPYMVNPEIPGDVCEIIEKAMTKDVDHRYQDYLPLIADLKQAKVSRLARERQLQGDEGPESEGGMAAPDPLAFQTAAEHAAASAPDPRGYAAGRRDVGEFPGEVSATGPEGRLTIRQAAELPDPPRVPSRLPIIAGVLLVLALGGMVLLSGNRDGEDGVGGLSGLIGAVLSIGKKEQSPEEVYIEQYETTLQQLDFLQAAVREYVATAGNYPKSLDDLVDRKIASDEDLLDGFDNPILYDTVTRTLRSAGPDRSYQSLDDFVVDERGHVIQAPEKPESMSLEEFTAVRE